MFLYRYVVIDFCSGHDTDEFPKAVPGLAPNRTFSVLSDVIICFTLKCLLTDIMARLIITFKQKVKKFKVLQIIYSHHSLDELFNFPCYSESEKSAIIRDETLIQRESYIILLCTCV